MKSADSCSQLVGGNYDVTLNDSSGSSNQSSNCSSAFKSILTNYLDRFEQLESELAQRAQQALAASRQPATTDLPATTKTTATATATTTTTTTITITNQQPVQVNCGYINEFQLLKEFSKNLKLDKQNIREGEEDVNQRKNRYKDIIPFSHTRVVLSSDPHLPGSCYINANYIRGPSGSPQAYIACQGPLQSTLIDFWRMIWECNVSVVIMACNEFESGKSKCEIYWPDRVNSSVNYGQFQVTLLKERQVCSDFLVRKLSIKLLPRCRHKRTSFTNQNANNATNDDTNHDQNSSHSDDLVTNGSSIGSDVSTASHNLKSSSSADSVGGGATTCHKSQRDRNCNHKHEPETRIICQFHYTTWPDHGAPISVQPILELVRLLREVQPAEDRPVVVHCSAGCGRTGTICCIDYVWGLLRRGKLDQNFDLCKIISDMRQQRMAMVQTLEQYILCHRAVAALFIDQLKLIDDHTYENIDDLGIESFDETKPLTEDQLDDLGSVFI